MRILGIGILILATFISARCSEAQREERRRMQAEEKRDKQFEAQRNFLELEREAIEAYIKDRKLQMKRSGTGLYYQSKLDSSNSYHPNTGDLVEFNYNISLLQGRTLYSSELSGSRNLMLDKQDAEMGVHELLKMLGEGEKALFILPSHLAFGVAGDQEEVPPRTPLVYEIELIKINKSN